MSHVPLTLLLGGVAGVGALLATNAAFHYGQPIKAADPVDHLYHVIVPACKSYDCKEVQIVARAGNFETLLVTTDGLVVTVLGPCVVETIR